MKFPLSFEELTIWLGIITIMLLVTSEILFSSGRISILLSKKRFQYFATFLGIIFVFTIGLRIFNIIT